MYGNDRKVVQACIDEIHALPRISGGDYKALVLYKKCIKNNHQRLKAADLEHEISNSSTMKFLVNRLPLMEADQWQKYKTDLPKGEKSGLFSAFLKWLEKSGHAWEESVADGMGRRNKDGKTTNSFFGFLSGKSRKNSSTIQNQQQVGL